MATKNDEPKKIRSIKCTEKRVTADCWVGITHQKRENCLTLCSEILEVFG